MQTKYQTRECCREFLLYGVVGQPISTVTSYRERNRMQSGTCTSHTITLPSSDDDPRQLVRSTKHVHVQNVLKDSLI